MEQQNGYHANIQDSHGLLLLGQLMEWELKRYMQGINAGDYKVIDAALTQLRNFAKTAETEAKSMVEGSRKEEQLQPIKEYHHEQ